MTWLPFDTILLKRRMNWGTFTAGPTGSVRIYASLARACSLYYRIFHRMLSRLRYRTDAFDSCMAANDPAVKILKDPTVWTEATAVTDAEDAINATARSEAIYVQWDSPDYGIIRYLASKGFGPAVRRTT